MEKELQSDWTKPPASSPELEVLFDCSDDMNAFLQR